MLELPTADLFEVGVDEAGRGPLFGPVVAAAVIMPCTYNSDDTNVAMIKDSKKMTKLRRGKMAVYIKENAIAYGIGIASVEEIDKHNILQANFIAMHRALDEVYTKTKFDFIKIDGDKFKPYIAPDGDNWIPYNCEVNGDDRFINIAAASILAKTYRDTYIEQLIDEHPEWEEQYGLRSNKGYGTKKHMQGLQTYGVTEHHRRSFEPVKKLIK